MKKTHETKPEPARTDSEAEYVNPLMLDMQKIEGGGTPKKADLDSMPSPIRYFGYFFFASATIMLIVGLWMQFMK
ncbi:hypothetical protein ACFQ88_32550 [Paenibacillus sp. NPDC056579]|uniref:hypothetical protein n=1 Tax=unclassified Paenibacillus TaxID=185978 RepID=UPI001EF82855|nr:hypothetical protein [Paenibacillus sp. H1-7]